MKCLSCLVLLALAALAQAKPPQAPPVWDATWTVTERGELPCGKGACGCGCADGKPCRCAASQQSPARPACGIAGCDCGCANGAPCICAKPVDELQKSYAAQYLAEGWTWSEAGGYWWKMPEAPAQEAVPLYARQPQMFSMPMQSYQPSHAQPMSSFGGFRSGGRSGGC